MANTAQADKGGCSGNIHRVREWLMTPIKLIVPQIYYKPANGERKYLITGSDIFIFFFAQDLLRVILP